LRKKRARIGHKAPSQPVRSNAESFFFTLDGLYPYGHNFSMKQVLRSLRWIGSAKKDLLAMPDEVQQGFGFALYKAQIGLLHPDAKPLKGFGSAGILEIVEDWRGNAYRAVLHGALCKRGLCLALLPEEVETRNRDAHGGYEFDSCAIEGSRSAGERS
jgi:hypothetical protein